MTVLLSTEKNYSSRKGIGIGLFLRLCFLVKGVPFTKRRLVRLKRIDKLCCSQEPLSLAAKRRYSVSENPTRSYGCSQSSRGGFVRTDQEDPFEIGGVARGEWPGDATSQDIPPPLARSKRSRVVMGARSVGRERRSSLLLGEGETSLFEETHPEKEVSSGKRFFNWMRKFSGKKEKKVGVARTSSNRSSVSSPRCESCQGEQESLSAYVERDGLKVISCSTFADK